MKASFRMTIMMKGHDLGVLSTLCDDRQRHLKDDNRGSSTQNDKHSDILLHKLVVEWIGFSGDGIPFP